jgi:hypothetical protein
VDGKRLECCCGVPGSFFLYSAGDKLYTNKRKTSSILVTVRKAPVKKVVFSCYVSHMLSRIALKVKSRLNHPEAGSVTKW